MATSGAGTTGGTRPPHVPWAHYWLVQPVEAAVVLGLIRLVRLLPVGLASATGDLLGRLGPLLLVGPTRRSLGHLAMCFPDWSESRRRATVRGMWRHLGRLMAEYPLLDRLPQRGRVEIVGDENIAAAHSQGRPIVLFSAHVGHWELSPLCVSRLGLVVAAVYRPRSNRFIDRAMGDLRARPELSLLPRGPQVVRQAMALLAAGGCLGMLVDQKRNNGVPLPLFGRPAYTAPALAHLALRTNGAVIPTRVIRLKGCRFRVCVQPPLTVTRTGDIAADAAALMTRVNAVIEDWVRDRPEQWLWPHRRWEL